MKIVSVTAVVVAGLCTTAFNWHFSYGLGRTETEALTWAIFSVALDVAKWTMLAVAARAGLSLSAVAAVAIWITATTYSFVAALGFASAARVYQEHAAQLYREHRTAIASARQSPLWRSTHACTHISGKIAREYCAALKQLETRQPPQEKEVQAQLIATLLNIPERTASLLLSFYLALTCEVISALGLFAVLTPDLQRERKSSWISRLSERAAQHPPATPPSSANAGSSTSSSPRSAPRPSPNSSRGFWQRPKSWR